MEATILTLRSYGLREVLIRDDPYHSFLVNPRLRSAVYLRSIAWKNKPDVKVNHPGNPDYTRRRVGASTASRFLVRFLRLYPTYTLVIPTGGLQHEVAFFVRRVNGAVHAILFNPNWSNALDAPQGNKLADFVLAGFGKSIPLRSYCAPNWNIDARCSAWAWQEIFEHMVVGPSPFESPKLVLYRVRNCD